MDSKLKLSMWGNSLGLRVPKKIANTLNLTEDTHVSVSLVDDQIMIKKIFDKPKNIKELFEASDYKNKIEDQQLIFPSGNLMGREII